VLSETAGRAGDASVCRGVRALCGGSESIRTPAYLPACLQCARLRFQAAGAAGSSAARESASALRPLRRDARESLYPRGKLPWRNPLRAPLLEAVELSRARHRWLRARAELLSLAYKPHPTKASDSLLRLRRLRINPALRATKIVVGTRAMPVTRLAISASNSQGIFWPVQLP